MVRTTHMNYVSRDALGPRFDIMDASLATDAYTARLSHDYGLHPLDGNKYEEGPIDLRTNWFLLAHWNGRTNCLIKCDLTELPPDFT